MGWNSFDCFGSAVTEAEVVANAEYMATRLKKHGWEYVVVDFCWSHPNPGACHNPNQGNGFVPMLACDRWGRLVPAPERFPSARDGRGFKPLAEKIHALGLKFGIHMMRGIPRQVVHEDMSICEGRYRASEIAVTDPAKSCTWLNHMWGVDAAGEAGRAYYDSLFELYASWGVDFVKVDDILADGMHDSTGPYHAAEVEAVARSIARCGRPMVLSLSPGDAPMECAQHVSRHANMWRISADFWDDWRRLERQFELCDRWSAWRGPGRWPDADMLPIGRLSKRGPKGPERDSWFTCDEQRSLVTLCAITQSPLMIGGNLPELDSFTLGLLTNDEVLRVNQHGREAHQMGRNGDIVVWIGRSADGDAEHIAVFNLGATSHSLRFDPRKHGLNSGVVHDLWEGRRVR
jgi:hypothetical protein